MTNNELKSIDGRTVVRISGDCGRYQSRLYVNGGETATLTTAKAKTLAGAIKQARRMIVSHVGVEALTVVG